MPAPRECAGALGLQDCMVVVGGRADIPDFEPVPLSCDTMCSAVEILWHRPPPAPQAPTGAALFCPAVILTLSLSSSSRPACAPQRG